MRKYKTLIATPQTKQLTEQEAFEAALQTAQSHGYGFAAWQMPLSKQRHFCVGNVTAYENDGINEEGFLFHPYDDMAHGHLIHTLMTLSFAEGKLTVNTDDHQLLNDLENHRTEDTTYYVNQSPIALDIGQDEFLKYVSKSVTAIKSGTFQKVVPARSKQISLTDQFDLFTNFNRLCEAYPNAFISVVSIPDVGTWMGATPEVLISVDQDSFETAALAGTQKHDADLPLSEVAWTQKEIEEQAMVSRYIINCFKKIRLREFEEVGPKTVIAANLIHLKTSFKVDMKATDFPDLGKVMLNLLHPTSAVCGMPKASAADFIKRYENGNREYYCGYLGPISSQGKINLFVNLRCMQLLDNSAILYAGAGVTEDSIPEKEWLETALKMNTLLNIIKL